MGENQLIVNQVVFVQTLNKSLRIQLNASLAWIKYRGGR